MALSIAILAAGAGGMYCGSCLRDHALAAALMRARHRVALVPMYTPLRTEEQSAADGGIFYGGVNVYLQHASALFRHTPRLLDWLLDRPALLKLAGRFGAQTPPARLGPLTLSVLRGEEGPAVKELRRLLKFLKADVRPQVVSLPNLMFIGLSRLLRRELGAPVVCELTGEDLFLEQMIEPYRSKSQEIIRERVADVSAFVATSADYADRMSRYLDIDRQRIAVVYPGVPAEYVAHDAAATTLHERSFGSAQDGPFASAQDGPPTVGYVARICPEKGFGQLLDTMALLRKMPGMGDARLIAGGYLGPGDRAWFDEVMRRAEALAPPGAIRYVGELDRRAKLELLDSIDVLSVPSVYAEAKGMYVLEAMARGVPVVQPAHGSFPELIESTGGGITTPPGDLPALAGALAELLRDPARRAALGRAGRDAVRGGFTDDHMARKMLAVYRDVIGRADSTEQSPSGDAMCGKTA
ncbi:MAG: glycosyltransferase family 4 protein [Tepidisphaeraceae bacterium]